MAMNNVKQIISNLIANGNDDLSRALITLVCYTNIYGGEGRYMLLVHPNNETPVASLNDIVNLAT
jgi:hypothetical protein